jgi:3-deoxy-D-arabino-heptulosonate 7-phosphate (DAHP) synthase class II
LDESVPLDESANTFIQGQGDQMLFVKKCPMTKKSPKSRPTNFFSSSGDFFLEKNSANARKYRPKGEHFAQSGHTSPIF